MACSKCDYMPEDLLTEIVIRLPLKSQFRFRCVSKAWHKLISSEHVQKKLPFTISGVYGHVDAENFRHQYACMSEGKFVNCNLSFFSFHSNSRVISCCNGLLLFQSLSSQMFHVCNPATKRWFALPSPKKVSLLAVLAFDPCISCHFSVFCFTGWRTQGAELQIFSSETKKWDEFDMHLGVESGALSSVMSYFNGILYILSTPDCIVCIHLGTMACQRIKLPEPAKGGAHLGKNAGRLCYYTGNLKNRLHIWMLEDFDNCRWELKHGNSSKALTDLGLRLRFLAFHPELGLVYFAVAGKLISYDMSKKRTEEVGDFEVESGRGYLLQLWLFQFSNCLSDCLQD